MGKRFARRFSTHELAPLMGLYWLRAREGFLSGVGMRARSLFYAMISDVHDRVGSTRYGVQVEAKLRPRRPMNIRDNSLALFSRASEGVWAHALTNPYHHGRVENKVLLFSVYTGRVCDTALVVGRF